MFVDQNFGVDLEARARTDRKRVPIVVTTILTYLDHRKALPRPSLLTHVDVDNSRLP